MHVYTIYIPGVSWHCVKHCDSEAGYVDIVQQGLLKNIMRIH